MWWIVLVVVALLVVRSILSAGNLVFWKAVRRHPAIAIMWMAFDERVWEFSAERPGPGYCGPFRIHDTESSIETVVWGRESQVEGSQQRFLALIDRLDAGQLLALKTRFLTEMMAVALAGGVATAAWRGRMAGFISEYVVTTGSEPQAADTERIERSAIGSS